MIHSINPYNTTLFFLIVVLLFLVISLTSPGFDLYSHSLFSYFYDQPIRVFYSVYGYILPRYGLLSIAYDFLKAFASIPAGWLAVLLVSIPLYYVCLQCKSKGGLIYYLFFLTSMYFAIYYASITVGLLWIYALHLTNKKIFLVGFLFHPFLMFFGFLYVLIYYNFFSYYLKLFFIMCVLAYIQYYYMQIFAFADKPLFAIDFSNPDYLFQKISRKSGYVNVILSALAVYFLTTKLKFKFKVFLKVDPIYLTLFFIFLVLIMHFLLAVLNVPTLFNCMEGCDVYVITFLDFFDRDFSFSSFDNLWHSRSAHLRR